MHATDGNKTNRDTGASDFLISVAILQAVAVGLLLELFISGSSEPNLFWKLIVATVVALGVLLRLGWLALVAIQVSLLIQEPRRNQFETTVSDLWYTLVALLAIGLAMGLPQPKLPKPAVLLLRLGNRVIVAVALVWFSSLVLQFLPLRQQKERWFQWTLANGQVIWPGATLLACILAVLVLVREVAWRQLSRSQASLYLRSTFLRLHLDDLRSVERRRRSHPAELPASEQSKIQTQTNEKGST